MKYSLNNEFLTVEFETYGGEIVSIKDKNNLEYLWQGDAKYWGGRAPILFPICGSLRNNIASTVDGKIVTMPRHGIVRKQEFDVIKVTENSISFRIMSNEELLKQYPFQFRLVVTYTLKKKTVTTSYKIENIGSEQPMPFFIGGHPGFRCPLFPEESFEDYLIEFEHPETADCPTSTSSGLIDLLKRIRILNNEDTLKLRHSYFSKDALVFDNLISRSVKLYHPITNKGVRVDFKDLPYLLIWSSSNEGPFIAIGPWTGLSTCTDEDDIFEHKQNVKYVDPNGLEEISFDITIL